MQFFTAAAFFAAATVVMAQWDPSNGGTAPAPAPPAPSGNTAQACGNGQCFSCCNTGSANIPVLGGACELPILGQACIGNQGFCCNADQNGLINIGSLCLPVTA